MKATWRQRFAPERAAVVVGLAGEAQVVGRHLVPLLAGDLAGLAADADRGVGEEADPLLRLEAPARRSPADSRPRAAHCRPAGPLAVVLDELAAASGPRGRRPGTMSQVAALTSWMWTFGSSAIENRSLAESPVPIAAVAPVVGQPDLVDDAALRPRSGASAR